MLQGMPRWTWILVTAYALTMASVSVIVMRELPWREALMARDFANVWIAGRAILAGEAGSLHDLAAYAELSREAIGRHWGNNYSYPPPSFFLAAPFGALPYPLAFLVWNVGSLVLFWRAARPVIPPELPTWAALFNPATLVCLVYGHYGLLMGALWLWAFRGSGIAAGLATIKPHMGLMIFVRALAERRMFLVAAATGLAMVLASILVFGLEPWRDFFSGTLGHQIDILERSSRVGRSMVTPIVGYGAWLHLAFAAAGIALLVRRFTVFTAATATFLVLPYGFHYDMTVACLGFAVLLAARWQHLAIAERAILLVAFFVPQLVRFGSAIAPPLLLAALWVQVRRDDTQKGLGQLRDERLALRSGA